jgi:16S rRNA (guanine527-N7)-methyltransferase
MAETSSVGALQALHAAAQAMHSSITAEQAGALLAYLELLQRWNATYNLTAVRDPAAMLSQHLVDCLALLPALSRHLQSRPDARRLLDAGSGGGLPGVVLAVVLPELDVTCVDAVGKKAAFVRQVAGALGQANLHAVHSRVEAMKTAPFDVITSRAFASLADFTRWTSRHLAERGVWLAMKGKAPDEEIAALPPSVEVFHVEPLLVPGLDAHRCLVWMRRAAKT